MPFLTVISSTGVNVVIGTPRRPVTADHVVAIISAMIAEKGQVESGVDHLGVPCVVVSWPVRPNVCYYIYPR